MTTPRLDKPPLNSRSRAPRTIRTVTAATDPMNRLTRQRRFEQAVSRDQNTVPDARSHWLVAVRKPSGYWDVLGMHLPLALLTGACLVVSVAVDPVRLPFRTCGFLRFSGYPCPFCGFTRAFHATANGRWGEAISQSPLAFLAFCGVVLVFAWHAAAVIAGRRFERGRLLRPAGAWQWAVVIFSLVLVLLNWVYRLYHGYA